MLHAAGLRSGENCGRPGADAAPKLEREVRNSMAWKQERTLHDNEAFVAGSFRVVYGRRLPPGVVVSLALWNGDISANVVSFVPSRPTRAETRADLDRLEPDLVAPGQKRLLGRRNPSKILARTRSPLVDHFDGEAKKGDPASSFSKCA